ncbi:uncharacterized protein LOC131165740 [Malania oleifera]|uniref:uncharacterized protein LOC131165740 n=1 Tax=Malania oleifera TaxID=397392 RepID=UPI0025AE4264|nr:uncharacterized protein LOC131165740 [Malania oleifera]
MNNLSTPITESHQQHQSYRPQQDQQQQPEQGGAYQPCDPSQAQAYDQSMQAYYAYYQYGQYSNPNQYPYYPHQDYAHAYQQQQEPTSIHPPGVPIPPAPTNTMGTEQTHFQDQQNAYYPHGVVEQQQQQQGDQQESSYSDSLTGGLNPSYTAGSSQLPQYAGNTGLQDQQWGASNGVFGPASVYSGPRPMHPQIGQSTYRGRRGGRPFRGGGRGRFGPPASLSHGKGHGHGGRGHFQPHGSASTPAGVPMPSMSSMGQPPLPAPAPALGHATTFWPPPRMAWCELCRVDCNTLEILEQHKNGKRHKKNLQIFEELQNLNKLITGMQNVQTPQMPITQVKQEAVHPEKIEGSEEKQPVKLNLPSEAVSDDHRVEATQQQDVEKSVAESTEEIERKPRTDDFDARGRGFKRNMKVGRGGKRMRNNEWPRRPVEPPKPKVVIPLICELCNVRCDSQVVFDTHLAGKKHLSNLKRFHGYQALFGAALQALCQPNPNASSTLLNPRLNQHGVQGPQGVHTPSMLYTLSNSGAPTSGQATALGPTPPAPAQVLDNQNQQDSKTQGVQTISETDTQKGVAVGIDAKNKGSSESRDKEVYLPPDNSVTAPSDGMLLDAGKNLPADAAVSSPEAEVTFFDQAVVPDVDSKSEEPAGMKDEEPTD